MILVSSPYSSKNEAEKLHRFDVVCKYTAKLVSIGEIAFSPIVYGHTLLQYHDMPSDWPFWKNFCEAFLVNCSEMHVLMLPGWKESSGVAAEIEYAKTLNIVIKYINIE